MIIMLMLIVFPYYSFDRNRIENGATLRIFDSKGLSFTTIGRLLCVGVTRVRCHAYSFSHLFYISSMKVNLYIYIYNTAQKNPINLCNEVLMLELVTLNQILLRRILSSFSYLFQQVFYLFSSFSLPLPYQLYCSYLMLVRLELLRKG